MDRDQETLGAYLKRERTSHRVPVEEVSLFLGVNRSFIDALEGGDFDVFPGRSECLRLVRKYIVYLKLNQTEVLGLFDAEWKRSGAVKRYPKLTQFADGDSSPVRSAMYKGKRLFAGPLRARGGWLSAVIGALIVASLLFIDLPGTKREITPPDHGAPSRRAIEALPAGNPVPRPAADAMGRTESPKRVTAAEAPRPLQGAAGGEISPPPRGVKVVGNRDSKRYHLPGMKYYDQVKAYHRVVFQSEREALRAGYRKARE